MRTAVIFDVGGVFLVPDEAVISRALGRSGLHVDEQLLSTAHYLAAHYVDDEARALTDRPYEIGYLLALGYADDELACAVETLADVWKLPSIDVWSQQIPGGAEVLARLSSEHTPLAVVSNSDGTVEDSLSRQGVCQVGLGSLPAVAAIVDSSIIGVAKPDSRIFVPALRALGYEPTQCVYVGDSERFDVRAAEAAGIRPLHYDPYGLCRNPQAHSHLASLSDLWDILE